MRAYQFYLLPRMLAAVCLPAALLWLAALAPAHADSLDIQRMMRECEFLLDEAAQPAPGTFDPRAPTVVVYHAYSTGRALSPAFRKRGLQVVHVGPAEGVPENFVGTFWANTFEASFTHGKDLRPLIRQLNDINVVAVLPGTDTGVLPADVVSTALNRKRPHIPTNGIQRGRKDKAVMQNVLAENGLEPVLQMVTSDVDEAIGWVRRMGLLNDPAKGVVIKPLLSAGGEGVTFPANESEMRDAFRALLGQEDGLGNRNAQLLVQEELKGVEYVVNSTVWDGHVIVSDILMYRKRRVELADGSHHLIYDHEVMLPYEGELQERLRAYNLEVIRALGIRYGMLHPEIMIDAAGRPKLVEMNARLMGAAQPVFSGLVTGRSQIDLIALAVSDPDAFARVPAAYSLRSNGVVFTIANLYDHTVRLKADARAKLRSLPGFFKDLLHVEPGNLMVPTENMFSQVGEVWLMHDDLNILMETVGRLHQMERNGELFSRP